MKHPKQPTAITIQNNRNKFKAERQKADTLCLQTITEYQGTAPAELKFQTDEKLARTK